MSFESQFLMAFRSGHLSVCRLVSFSVDYATHLLIKIQINTVSALDCFCICHDVETDQAHIHTIEALQHPF